MRALFLVAVLALLVPSTAATWRVAGSFEPDTPYDDATWMFQDPPPVGSKRIYFNGITHSGFGFAISPNVGLLETRNEAPVLETQGVLLGVWADCNGDGYIGMAEQGFREYSASLLLSTAACPAVTGPTNAWTQGAHNYNGWVSEFLFIGRSGSQRIYPDPAVRVWGDYERPDHQPILGQCPLTPHPRGTYQSTGGLLNFYVGCRLDQKGIEWAGSFNGVMDVIGDPLSLKFEDEYDATSGALGQVKTFGSDHQQNSPAYVWDCEQPMTTVGPARIGAPDPRLGNSDPSDWTIPGFFNHTHDGLPGDDCDWTNDRTGGFYPEDDYNSVNPWNKTEADWNFKFAVAGRGGPPLGTVIGGGPSGAPSDGGVGWIGLSTVPAVWGPDNAYGSKLGPNMIRANLEGVQIASAYYVSFYAQLGAATIARGFDRPINSAVYGAWQCGGETTGIHHGWNCDPAIWNRNPDGTPYPPEIPYVVVGESYHLRDVDCYDGGNSLGVPIGVPGYGADTCA